MTRFAFILLIGIACSLAAADAPREREALNGLCLVIVRARAGEPGTLKLTAKAEGLESGTTSIKTTTAR